jgi:hypothetical protein
MRRGWQWFGIARLTAASGLVAAVHGGVPAAGAQAAPDSTDRVLVAVVDAALQTAGRASWPGYDAVAQSVVVYRAGRWAILVNPPAGAPAGGWLRYPASWPALARPAWLDPDGDPGLIGQLGFDYDAPGGLVVAIPLDEALVTGYGARSGAALFSFLVHEAFHQFQRGRFADVETPSEEQYPMLDAVNNALAALEFLALRDAVRALGQGDSAGAKEAARVAMAVHAERWDRLDEVARGIERSKEVVEGTAKYVETRFVSSFAGLCRSGAVERLGPLCRSFEGLDAATWLADDFDRRLTGGAIAPADMARNRIYPVAAAVALLLDEYEPAWKTDVEREGTSRGLFAHLDAVLGVGAVERAELLEGARTRHGWRDLLSSSEARVREYVGGFERAMSAFEAEGGVRVVVRVPTAGVSRSRQSRAERWVVDAGRRTLGRFVAWTLRRRGDPALELRLENLTVLDEVSDDGRRTVTAHVPAPVAVTVDGEPLPAGFAGTRAFDSIAVEAAGTVVRAAVSGSVTVLPGVVRIDLGGTERDEPESPRLVGSGRSERRD